jgi:hypothetical protein
MILLGIVLFLAGFLLAMPILTTLGVILVVGLILMVLDSTGRAVGGTTTNPSSQDSPRTPSYERRRPKWESTSTRSADA